MMLESKFDDSDIILFLLFVLLKRDIIMII